MTVDVDASLGGSDPAAPTACAGIGGFLFTTKTPATDAALAQYLQRMRALSARSMQNFTCEGGSHCFGPQTGPAPVHSTTSSGSVWPFHDRCDEDHCAGLTQEMVPIASTKEYAVAPTSGMVGVPGGAYSFSTRGAEIEGGPGAGVDGPWLCVTTRSLVRGCFVRFQYPRTSVLASMLLTHCATHCPTPPAPAAHSHCCSSVLWF